MHLQKGAGFITVRAVAANLVSKDAQDLKEKSHENGAVRSSRVADLSRKTSRGADSAPPPACLGLRVRSGVRGWGRDRIKGTRKN